MRQVSTLSVVAFAALVAGSSSSFAGTNVNRNGVVWDATFEGDVAPMLGSTPAWGPFDTQGVGANESSDGNLYTINTSAVSAAVSYEQTGVAWTGAGLVRTAEIRTRVVPTTYEAFDGAVGIILGVNGVAFNLRFHSGFVTFNNGGALGTAATLDTTQFHTYRMVVDMTGSPNFALYIDGASTPDFTSNSSWFNSAGFDKIVFGDFSTGGLAGHTETDFISWTSGAHPLVPEPTSLSLLAVAGAMALRRRR